MPTTRAFGVLLHPTSLPGRFGAGGFGPAAREMVDFLRQAGATWWQWLPIGPVGAGGSPYSSTSVFAGNPWLIDLERLVDERLLGEAELALVSAKGGSLCDFAANEKVRGELLDRAFVRSAQANWLTEEQRLFFERERWWLEDFAIYSALKKRHGGQPFFAWPDALRGRSPREIDRFKQENTAEIEREIFLQFLFHRDLEALRAYAHESGVYLMGDVPIFCAHDSADVWAHPEIFQIDVQGNLRAVAGVPPDAFSDDGQLWGNPLYDWDFIQRTGFEFWVKRLGQAFRSFDCIRLDHFIGFVRYWAIPRTAKTAKQGKYEPGPGRALFDRLHQVLGDVSLIAEDLGILTDQVKALRDDLELPGMNVLQFSFGTDKSAEPTRPHRYQKRSVVYTGTHDNDTTAGWLGSAPDDASKETLAHYQKERAFALHYLGVPETASVDEQVRAFVRAAFANQADLAMIPAQDLLAQGRDHRMNRPGIVDGNWAYRAEKGELGPELAARLRELGQTFGRESAAPVSAASSKKAAG